MAARSIYSLFLTVLLAVLCFAETPAEVYDDGGNKNAPILLNIGTGGAGQSGLVKELAVAFIKFSTGKGKSPFRVAWYKSDTTYTIQNLETGAVDVGITYNIAAEEIAIKQGIAKDPAYYAFRDHFLLVGPKSNPANIDGSLNITDIFSQLHEAAEDPANNGTVRFLSRYDKSATNIKESELWARIGQVPWATAYSTWYHQYISFPIQALTAAILLDEYTISDRGTLLSLDPELANQTTVYKVATDDAHDDLLNPAHLLVGAKAINSQEAQDFADWVVSKDGQSVISGFKKNGQQLYSPAP